MTAWILIIFIFTPNGSGAATAEFSSKANCEAAAATINEKRSFTNLKTYCVPK